MNRAYIVMGSNDNAAHSLKEGLRLLAEQVRILAVSPVYESDAVGGGPPYLNAAAILETQHDPQELKHGVLRPVEAALGRRRDGDTVSLDLDIILFNNECYHLGEWQIPDPGLYQHAFIAVPLVDIAPHYLHPATGETLAQIAAGLRGTAQLRRRDDVHLSGWQLSSGTE